MMVSPHPATLLVAWISLLVGAALTRGACLYFSGMLALLLAFQLAHHRLTQLFRRSRWLLIVMLLTCLWITPGTRMLPEFGLSREGLELATENATRLMFALATLALLLKRLSTLELVAGLHRLVQPLRMTGLSPDRFAVRLALTLEEVQAGGAATRHERDVIALPALPVGKADALVLLAAGLLVLLMIGA